jgi:hypothetical protein
MLLHRTEHSLAVVYSIWYIRCDIHVYYTTHVYYMILTNLYLLYTVIKSSNAMLYMCTASCYITGLPGFQQRYEAGSSSSNTNTNGTATDQQQHDGSMLTQRQLQQQQQHQQLYQHLHDTSLGRQQQVCHLKLTTMCFLL